MSTVDADAIDELAGALRPHYSRFLAHIEADILMTGHSHQAWPDVSREAQLEAWDDAALRIDDKWQRVFGEILPSFREGVARRIGTTRSGDIAIAPNTHELVYRFASCFFPERATVVTTDSEFHSLRRQLDRLAEDGATVVRVPVGREPSEREGDDPAGFGDRFIAALEEHRPAWAALSYVLFTTSRVITSLPAILEAAARLGVAVLVDAYHGFNTLELEVDAWPGDVFVVGGGYKYAQFGEGACWMLLPADASRFRPRSTGWFADFASLERPAGGEVSYASGGDRFFGATFDPTGLYRATRVMRWMDENGLTPRLLRSHSLRQTAIILERHKELNLAAKGLRLATPAADAERGAFVSFGHEDPQALVRALREAGVHADARTPYLRFGPAPYTTSAEINGAMLTLANVSSWAQI